jgi:hypothetical protein
MLYFYCKVLYFKIFSVSFRITFLSSGIATSTTIRTRSLVIIPYYNVWLVIVDSPVSLYFLVPQYGIIIIIIIIIIIELQLECHPIA